ncbi:MAG: UDP-N-acetylmuramoyl-tripeptide--D-alanyl-D-alanine ligase, partial [Defluviitaleaceae bacterium]|nr:UDP-N-acetylmuramoyl-tripeptide--D-alanyl-D-alanine ligase [Defluviitaleaceae bacterium]
PSPGRHMVLNSLAAVAVGDYLGLDGVQIARGIANFIPSGMRNMTIETAGGIRIIADCYNANPESMKAALETLSLADGRTIAVLGDMFELGENSAAMHYGAGQAAAELCIDVIICVGKAAEDIYEGAFGQHSKGASNSQIIYFETKSVCIGQMPHIVQPRDTVLVKASRGMQFEDIVTSLERL